MTSNISYPYSSTLAQQALELERQGRTVEHWTREDFDMESVLVRLSGAVVEIGGPTKEGFYFLDNITLPSEVAITNLTHNADITTDKHIQKLVDGRQLPYSDNSLAVVLALHIPLTNINKYEGQGLSEDEEGARIIQDARHAGAIEARIAETGEIKPEDSDGNQRLAIASEVLSKLESNGLYLTDGSADEIKVYEIMGFMKVASINVHSFDATPQHIAPYYHVVLQKV